MVLPFTEYSKLFHSYIRNKKVGRPSVGPLKLNDGTVVDSNIEMAELFAESFASVYRSEDLRDQAPHQTFDGSLTDIEFSREETQKLLEKLDVSSSVGPDLIHPRLLKSCAQILSYPLYLIFMASFYTSLIPREWTTSRIIPIFKKGSRSDPLNYRPISLTSVCCKTMERIVADRLVGYLEENGILSREQFGFRKGMSVEDQLLLTYNDISKWVDQGFVVDLVFFDFSKAFDVVNHAIMLIKLKSLGVSDYFLDWINAFLTDRTMGVAVGGEESGSRPVGSGVPQGSVLGPILFLIYVNFIASGITCSFKIFADDLKLYLFVRHSSFARHSY